jgi:hypothetical protein
MTPTVKDFLGFVVAPPPGDPSRTAASDQTGPYSVQVSGGSYNVLPAVFMPPPSGGDDTISLANAIAALPTLLGVPNVGVVQFGAGMYQLASTFTHGRGQIFRGVGGELDGIPAATTTITFTNDGQGWVVPHNLYRWGIEQLAILGTPANANQDLLTIGDASGGVGYGYVRDVGVQLAGRDNLVLASALNTSFFNCSFQQAGRYNLYASMLSANTNNQIAFERCLFRLAQQWGVRWSGGADAVFVNCDIESNSRSTTADYGGFLFDVGSVRGSVCFVACHFENNKGVFAGAGVPLNVNAANINSIVSEIGTTYSDGAVNASQLNGGKLASVGISTSINPHMVIANSANVDSATFIGPSGYGTNFAITDNKGCAIVLNPRGNVGQARIGGANPLAFTNASAFAATATAGAAALPAAPVGFLIFTDSGGTARKLPYYAT